MSPKIATIRLLDEVNCVVLGLNERDREDLYKEYGLFKEGAQFSPQYKLGRWDGKIRFFQKTGKTFINLLDEIVPSIRRLGYDIKLDDRRTAECVFPEPIDNTYLQDYISPKTGKPIILERHQVDMANELFAAGSGIAIAGTGAGKTYTCAVIADVYGKLGLRCIIIVPDKTLVRQTRKSFIDCGVDTGIYYGEEKDLNHLHVVSTWQSLQNSTALLADFQVVICDETHQAKAAVLSKLLNEHCAHIAHRFGMTGTLPKEKTDLMSIKASLGPVRFTYKSADLIEDGWLANLQIDVVQVKPDMRDSYQKYLKKYDPIPRPTYKQFKRSFFPDWQAEKNYLQKDENRLKYIANEIYGLSLKDKGNVLCLVNGVDVGKKLARMIEGSIFVYGNDDVKEREKVYKLFQTEDHIVVIATMHIAAVGLDIARIFNFCLLDFGKSFVKTIQAIGRGLRKAHDKDFVYVRDYCSDLKFGQKHMNDRIGYYKEQQYPHKKIEIDLSEWQKD